MQRDLNERGKLVRDAAHELRKLMVVPTCNLNGNSAEDLTDKARKVLDAWRELDNAFAAANDIVHGRNYQLQSDADRSQALAAWGERRVLMEYLRREFEALAYSIADQRK